MPRKRAAPTWVNIPVEVWTPSYCRNPMLFNIVDPLERYRAVNKNNRRGGGGGGGGGTAGGGTGMNLIDVHYQTAQSVVHVLDLLLPEYDEVDVWIVTGTGHHKGGHQKIGVLFDTVGRYLDQHERAYAIGKARSKAGKEETGAYFVLKRK